MSKQSERVRGLVRQRYIQPALNAGQRRLSISVRDVLKDAEATQGFARSRTPTVCRVLLSGELLNETGFEIESVEGPPSRQSRSVVVHYRLVSEPLSASLKDDSSQGGHSVSEIPAERAERLVNRLRGLLKEELAEYGGGEAYMRWMRYDEKPGS